MPKNTQGIESIKSESWKNQFLSLISSLEEIQVLSKEINRSLSFEKRPLALEPLVKNILTQYKRKELFAARQYYNNSHLIGFWKWYNKILKELIHSGRVDSEFSVFSASRGHFPGTMIIEPHNVDFFQSFTYKKDPKRPFKYHRSKKNVTTADKNTSYEQLVGQLHLLHDIIKKSTIFFYKKFIFEQKSNETSYFDDYRIHEFLDLYLFRTTDGQMCGAPFERIFFSNNLIEFEVYLNYCNDDKYKPNLIQAAEFLERQRIYYMALAMNIGVEDNAYLNSDRHLLHYDIVEEVVVMPKLNKKKYTYLQKELALTGIIKMDGCPFAKSKGISKNAVVEVYSRFDSLMLKLFEYWNKQ